MLRLLYIAAMAAVLAGLHLLGLIDLGSIVDGYKAFFDFAYSDGPG